MIEVKNTDVTPSISNFSDKIFVILPFLDSLLFIYGALPKCFLEGGAVGFAINSSVGP